MFTIILKMRVLLNITDQSFFCQSSQRKILRNPVLPSCEIFSLMSSRVVHRAKMLQRESKLILGKLKMTLFDVFTYCQQFVEMAYTPSLLEDNIYMEMVSFSFQEKNEHKVAVRFPPLKGKTPLKVFPSKSVTLKTEYKLCLEPQTFH